MCLDANTYRVSLWCLSCRIALVAPLEEASILGVRHVLFICSRNQLRSPTAEQVFSSSPGFEVASTGLDAKCKWPVTSELLAWAEVIFVMERHLKQCRG
jgi:hypothetical protein